MLPQLVKVIRHKQADEVSSVTLIILISGLALWVYYGVLKEEYPIILTNAFSCLVNSVLLYCKIRYRHSN